MEHDIREAVVLQGGEQRRLLEHEDRHHLGRCGGREKGAEEDGEGGKEPNSPPPNQRYNNIKIIDPTGLPKRAKLTQEEERRAVIFGVADDVLQGGGQRTVHHFVFEVKID